MRDDDVGGEGGDKLVSLVAVLAGGAVLMGGKGRKEEQSPISDAGFPGGGDPEPDKAAGGADNDWGFAAQEDCQTFFFDRGVKAAHDGPVRVPESRGKIESADDGAAGAFVGTKKGGEGLAQNLKVADGVEGWRVAAEEGYWVLGVAGMD